MNRRRGSITRQEPAILRGVCLWRVFVAAAFRRSTIRSAINSAHSSFAERSDDSQCQSLIVIDGNNDLGGSRATSSGPASPPLGCRSALQVRPSGPGRWTRRTTRRCSLRLRTNCRMTQRGRDDFRAGLLRPRQGLLARKIVPTPALRLKYSHITLFQRSQKSQPVADS